MLFAAKSNRCNFIDTDDQETPAGWGLGRGGVAWAAGGVAWRGGGRVCALRDGGVSYRMCVPVVINGTWANCKPTNAALISIGQPDAPFPPALLSILLRCLRSYPSPSVSAPHLPFMITKVSSPKSPVSLTSSCSHILHSV